MRREVWRSPRYVELAETIEAAIARRELNAGDYLPPEQYYARRFDVSRGTARKALAELESRGWITPVEGKKRRVARGAEAEERTFLNVPCFGCRDEDNARFASSGYNILYERLIEAFHSRNVGCPKVPLAIDSAELPAVIRTTHIDASLLLSSIPTPLIRLCAKPTIQYLRRYDDEADYVFDLDDMGVAIDAVKRLWALGDRRIGYVYWDLNFPAFDRSLEGYRRAARELGFEPLVMSRRENPDVFFAANGELLKGLDAVLFRGFPEIDMLKGVQCLGPRVAETLSLMAISPCPIAVPGVPIVSGYRENYARIADALSDFVIHAIKGEARYDAILRGAYDFVAGETLKNKSINEP